jgi:hypothetical protein
MEYQQPAFAVAGRAARACDDRLDEAMQHLTRLLLAEDRDVPAIIEAADVVRRAERLSVEAQAGAASP